MIMESLMRRGRKRRGFTLTEMLVTLSIMIVVAGVAIPLFVTSRARTRRSEAVNAVKAALAAARQAAVERRTAVAVEFFLDTSSANRGDYMVVIDKSIDISGGRQIGSRIRLPDFIKFDDSPPDWTLENGWGDDDLDMVDAEGTPDIVYQPDGTAGDPARTTDIALLDTDENLKLVLRVLPATGLVVRAEHRRDPTQPPDDVTNPMRKGWL